MLPAAISGRESGDFPPIFGLIHALGRGNSAGASFLGRGRARRSRCCAAIGAHPRHAVAFTERASQWNSRAAWATAHVSRRLRPGWSRIRATSSV